MAVVSGVNRIDALLSGYRWTSGAYGAAVSVTYSFLDAVPSYGASWDAAGFQPMGERARAAAARALAAWSEVANVTFQEVSDDGAGGQIRLGTNRQSGSAAYAYYPGADAGGDIYLNNASWTNQGDFADGSYGFMTLLHELGHAIGLKHPGNYNAGGGGTDGPYLGDAEDNRDFTVMAYDTTSTGIEPATPQPYDIAAIQYLYGANRATRTGDDTYVAASGKVFTVWDAGGSDTIDGSALGVASTIDLTPGAFSSLGKTRNLAIAYDVVIENATGGTGNDTLVGNDAANRLDGGAGDDTLRAGNGDAAVGGAGGDRLEMQGGSVWAWGVETVAGSAGSDVLVLQDAGATVTVSAVETVRGGGVEVVVLERAAVLSLAAVETLIGSAGADGVTLIEAATVTLAGVESVSGGGGDFVFLAGTGATVALAGIDYVAGSTGADLVALSGSAVIAAVESITGGGGADSVWLGNRGNTVLLAGVESVTGGLATDFLALADAGATLAVSGVEFLLGGAGRDVLSFAGTMVAAALESVAGSPGADALILGNRGNTLAVSGAEAVVGGLATDFLTLADAGNRFAVAAVDYLLGGAGADEVALFGVANTLVVAAVESVSGGAGADMVALGNRGNTIALSGIETVACGIGRDVITLADGIMPALQGFDSAMDVVLVGGAPPLLPDPFPEFRPLVL